MFKFLEGKKTYLVMVVMIALSAANGFSDWCGQSESPLSFCFTGGVPEWVYTVLATLGIYTRKVART